VSHDLAKTFTKSVAINQPIQRGSAAKSFSRKSPLGQKAIFMWLG